MKNNQLKCDHCNSLIQWENDGNGYCDCGVHYYPNEKNEDFSEIDHFSNSIKHVLDHFAAVLHHSQDPISAYDHRSGACMLLYKGTEKSLDRYKEEIKSLEKGPNKLWK